MPPTGLRPGDLKAADFAAYPPQARRLAIDNLPLLRQLPPVFLPILLREAIAYDWKFPAERHEMDGQLAWLAAMPANELAQTMQGFAALALKPELTQTNWVSNPSGFVEDLTASLWSTGQMDAFRAAADTYTAHLAEVVPPRQPRMPRLGIVVLGQGVDQTHYPLFRKLRPSGVYLANMKPADGLEILLAAAAKRAAAASGADAGGFAHWYIDGGPASGGVDSGGVASPSAQLAQSVQAAQLTLVSYGALDKARTLLLDQTQKAIQSGSLGPEGLRSMLAQMTPEDIGLDGKGKDAVLDRFQLSLLTQGSGTQIFSTTFVQWAARECIRRAQPETLLLRYAPRRKQEPMNAMLSGQTAGGPDPAGSLVDADMGAYYTWLNMRRLTDSAQARFLVWFEGHKQAVAIGPGLPKGTTSDSAMDMHQVMALLG